MTHTDLNLDLERGTDAQSCQHTGRASWKDAANVIVAEVIGIGVLGLPYTLSELGWELGISLMLLLALSNMYSSLLIHRLVISFPEVTKYADLGRLYGKGMHCVTYAAVNGFLVMLVIADFLTAAGALEQLVHGAGGHLSVVFCGIILFFVMLPVVQIQSLHGLTHVTMVGIITILLPLIITIVKLFSVHSGDTTSADTSLSLPPQASLVRTTAALFSIIFAYCFQVVQVELMSEMHTPTDFRKTIFTTHAFIVVVYIAVAAIVYYLAGSEVPDPMTQIFDSTDPALGAVINAMLFVHASIALSINCTVFNQTVAAAVTNWSHRRTDTGTGNESGSDGDEKTRETLPITKYSDVGQNKPATPLPLPSFSEGEFPNRDSDDNGNITSAGSTLHASRGVWFGVSVATLVVAFVVSNSVVMFGDLVNIIGASFGMMTCYILPAVLVLLLLGKDTALLGTFERVFLWFVLGVAVPLSGLGMYATITLLSQNLGDSKNSPWQ